MIAVVVVVVVVAVPLSMIFFGIHICVSLEHSHLLSSQILVGHDVDVLA